MSTYNVPDGKKYTLALVIAGPVFVGLAKVAENNWSVNGTHDLSQGNALGFPGQDITPAYTAFGSNQASTFEGKKDLFQIGLR